MWRNLGFIEDAMLQKMPENYYVHTKHNSSCTLDYIMRTSQSQKL